MGVESAAIRAMARPGAEEFSRLARPGAIIPVYATIAGDCLTPVTAYERLAARSEYSFLLESVVGGERIARYSFLGAAPRTLIQAIGHQVTVEDRRGRQPVRRHLHSPDPLHELENLLGPPRAIAMPGLPAFIGGAVGYAGYDTVRYLEPEKLAAPPPDTRHLPDLLFGIYDELVIFDHVQKTILLVACAHHDGSDQAEIYAAALERLQDLRAALTPASPLRLDLVNLADQRRPAWQSNFTRSAFEQAVREAKQYIQAGDIFQVVLSQCLSLTSRAHPFAMYRALRMINPSPFMFYLAAPDCTLVGSSPEIMCRVENGLITNRPLAGTRRRGATPQEDQRLEQELLADAKERAEHVMLVDLGRNDVGRVAQRGTVRLRDVLTVERYSHVMHLTTHVTGQLEHGKSCLDALRMTLPVGTVSGAPKIRAMQIIDELEPTRRGPYGGAVGYIDYSGNMDTCIALRTLVVRPTAPTSRSSPVGAAAAPGPGLPAAPDAGVVAGPAEALGAAPPSSSAAWRVDLQVGAGLVADSVPANEYQETLNKAAGLLQAVALAEAVPA